VGEADDLARFTLPSRIVGREAQLASLNQALADVAGVHGQLAGQTRVVNLSGADGAGKTRILRQFAQDVESDTNFPVAWAKVDETIHPPLSSFTQVFTALLDRFLTDPNEDIVVWKEKIRAALGNRFHLFISLIPTDYWRLLGVSAESKLTGDTDWTTLKGSFAS
jgi:predicted ATPase